MGRVIICVGTAGVGDARGGLRIVWFRVVLSRDVCVGMCILLAVLDGVLQVAWLCWLMGGEVEVEC